MIQRIIRTTFLLLATYTYVYSQCVGTPGQVSWHYWEDIYHYDMAHLYLDDTYPKGPDNVKILNSVSTPNNYQNYYGSITKGFISPPENGMVTFNLTGDDDTVLFLSTDESSANLDTAAYIDGHTGEEEYNKYPSQTSQAVSMTAGQLYYFEIHHRDGGGGDHAILYWQRPYLTDSTWLLITSPYLTDVCDPICIPKGTPCDDGNANTSDDIEDGSCNCIGKPDTTGLPVGERSVLDAYFYDDASNGNLSELYPIAKYPAMPDRYVKVRTGLYVDWEYEPDNYGSLIQGYLTVPITGSYDFNLTGARNVSFHLNKAGSNPTPTDTIYTRWGTDRTEHDEDPSQTMTGIQLSANTYYYFELIQAVSTWGHRFNVFWKGPQYEDGNWHIISEIMYYDYTNEMACLPTGQACDDGDIFTANDQILANCDCAGTPCTPFLDCDDPAAEFIKYDYCEISNSLGNRADDAWVSCNPAPNSYVPERSGNHWIHYDLGQEYVLKASRIWNYNVTGQTALGFQNVAVDYSIDGVEWFQLGDPYIWALASGDNTYTGFEGPNFNGITARYVLFTSLDGVATCRGINKVSFTAEACLGKGKPCDDGDMATLNDHFDDYCQCLGYTVDELDCVHDTLFIYEDDLNPNAYHAMRALMSGGRVMNSSDIEYKAGVEIVLEAGFEIEIGSQLTAQIEDCVESVISLEKTKEISKTLNQVSRPPESLSIYPQEGKSEQVIRMYLPKGSEVTLEILTQNLELAYPVIRFNYADFGDYYKRIQTKRMEFGIYMVRMITESGSYLEKMLVI